jgi:PadR family transcriptional regulator AphA
MKRLNKTRYAILGILTQRPMSGYDIKKEMDESTQYFWQESPGQIYPILAKLLREKLVTCTNSSTSGSRVRNIYKITATGLKELKTWLAQDVMHPTPRNELLLKLFFGKNSADEINHYHVKKYHQQLKNKLKQYEQAYKNIKHDPSEHAPYWLMTLKYGEKILHAQLEWCDEILKRI